MPRNQMPTDQLSRNRLYPTALVCCCLVVAALLGSATVAAEQPKAPDRDLLAMVPDNADLTLVVDDMPGLISRWRQAPLSRLWSDPQMRQFFAPLREQLEVDQWDQQVKEETGYELEELLAMLQGGLVIYAPDLVEHLTAEADDGEESADAEPHPVVVLLAEVGDQEQQLRELLVQEMERRDEELADGTSWVVEEHREIEMQILREVGDEEPDDQLAWALHNGVLAVATPGEQLPVAIDDLLDGGTPSPLTASAAFQSQQPFSHDHDLLFFANVAHLVPPLQRLLAERAAAKAEAGQAAPVRAGMVLATLGLDSLLSVFTTFDIDQGISAFNLGVTYTEPLGLLQIMAYGPGEAPRPKLIPADATGFATAAFDVQEAWAGLRQAIQTIMPGGLEMLGAQVAAATQQAGVELDLRRDLLENLGGEVLMVQGTTTPAAPGEQLEAVTPEQVIAISIHQRQGIELTIETLKGMAGQGSELFEQRDFLGTTIYTLKQAQAEGQPAAVPTIAYAVTDSHLLLGIGGTTSLEAMLIAMSKPGSSAWQNEKVQAAFKTLPAGAAALGYQDMARTSSEILETLALLGVAEDKLVEPEVMPDAGLVGSYLGPMVSGIYRNSTSMVFRMRLLPATKAAK